MSFRGDAARVRERMPPSLSRFARSLTNRRPGKIRSSSLSSDVELEVTPAELEAALVFGRETEDDGRTFLRSAIIDDRYERADLDGLGIVELVKPFKVEAPPILNLASAYVLTWSCTRCDRVSARQVGDLEVGLQEAAETVPGFRGHPDVLFTPGGRMLLVASRWQPLLSRYSVETRPLVGTRAFVQVVSPETVALRTDRAPLSRDETCPDCRNTSVSRVGIVEGNPPFTDEAGLWVSRELPLSIEAPRADLPAIAVSTRRVDELLVVHPDDVHEPGQRVPPERVEAMLEVQGWNVSFVSETLFGALWDEGATGLAFRPVVRLP
jgi:hypothetical protein